MNIISIINTSKVDSIPSLLRELADLVERDIEIMDYRANAIGDLYTKENGVLGNFDYQVQRTSLTSLSDFIDYMEKEKGKLRYENYEPKTFC